MLGIKRQIALEDHCTSMCTISISGTTSLSFSRALSLSLSISPLRSKCRAYQQLVCCHNGPRKEPMQGIQCITVYTVYNNNNITFQWGIQSWYSCNQHPIDLYAHWHCFFFIFLSPSLPLSWLFLLFLLLLSMSFICIINLPFAPAVRILI